MLKLRALDTHFRYVKSLFAFVIIEVWIWRDWNPEASCKTEEGRVWKPPSCVYTPHTCLRGQRGRRGGENCCRIGGKLKHGLCMLIKSSIGCCSMSWSLFLLFMLRPQSATGFCARIFSQADKLTIITTCSSSRCHMSPLPPGTGSAQRSHTAQSHTSSPRAHRSQTDRWTLMAAWTVFEMACLEFDGAQSQRLLIIQCLFCVFLSYNLWALWTSLLPPQLFERAPLRLALPPPLSLPVSPRSRKHVPPCRLDLWPSEAPGTEVTHWPWVLWSAALFSPLHPPPPHTETTSYCSASSHIHSCWNEHKVSLQQIVLLTNY